MLNNQNGKNEICKVTTTSNNKMCEIYNFFTCEEIKLFRNNQLRFVVCPKWLKFTKN